MSCLECSKRMNKGSLVYQKAGQGWQVRRFFTALEDLAPTRGRALASGRRSLMDEGEGAMALPSLEPDSQEEGHYEVPKPRWTESQKELNIYDVPRGIPAGPTAPSISNWETTNQQPPHQTDTDLEKTVERCWPKDVAYAAQLAPPVGATHHMKGF